MWEDARTVHYAHTRHPAIGHPHISSGKGRGGGVGWGGVDVRRRNRRFLGKEEETKKK